MTDPKRRPHAAPHSWHWVAVLVSLPCLAIFASPCLAEIKLASPFSRHMVLQRDMPVPVWGVAEPGERVTVEFGGQSKHVDADAAGAWRVSLDPMPASAESRTVTVAGSKSATPVRLDDVLVGEVWLGSGQSNMEFKMSKRLAGWAGVVDEAKEIAAADFPQVRMFTAKLTAARTPQASVVGEWQVCTPENVPGFSAIGYFFARDLHRELKVPIGFLTLAYGASTAQSWVRQEALEAVPDLKAQLDLYADKVKKYVPPSPEEMEAWQAAVDKAKAEKTRAPRQPKPDPSADQHNPTTCYNGMLAPVVPYAIRGVIWYQGESITAPAELFPRYNEVLIADWRKLWGRDLPFYFFQLAALENRSNSPKVREWQAQALKVPNTAMAVTIDIGDPKDVHPHNKQDAGARAARIALARDYGRPIEYSGPVLDASSPEADAIRVRFKHAAGGLVTKDGGPLNAFEIAGEDGKYVPAEATIDGETVVVRAAGVTTPATVRYAWANYPKGANLFNKAGLPAAPFRTDTAALK